MESKSVLITGGSRGIGKQLVNAFLDEGHKVIATCRDKSKSQFQKHKNFKFRHELKYILNQSKSIKNQLKMGPDPLQRPCEDPAKGAERSKTAQGRPRTPQEPPETTKMHL